MEVNVCCEGEMYSKTTERIVESEEEKKTIIDINVSKIKV